MKQLVMTAMVVLAVGATAQAQLVRQSPARGQSQQAQKPVLPAEMIPPPGMCRIWLKDLPAKQQPAPTDCATATRTKPANAYLYYGDDYAKKPTVRPPATTIVSPGTGASRVPVSQLTTKPPATVKPPIKPPGGGG